MRYFLVLACFASFMGCSAKPFIIKQTDISIVGSRDVSIVSHGWHTGFVVPADTIRSRLPELASRFGKAPYLEFGWGDLRFYQAEKITSHLTLKAIFWPTQSVVHVAALPEKPEIYFSNSELETLCLHPRQYALLMSFIENSFYRNNNGSIVALENPIHGISQFYKGEGDYYLMNTCNTWTAKGLQSAGLSIHPTFKLTADSIMSFLSEKNSDLSKGSCEEIKVKDIFSHDFQL